MQGGALWGEFIWPNMLPQVLVFLDWQLKLFDNHPSAHLCCRHRSVFRRMFVQPFKGEKVILHERGCWEKNNIASIPYSLDNILLKIYFWYFYDSALHNVCIIKYDVHIERCTALLGIIHCGAAWPLVSLLLQAAGTPGTRTNETKLICIGTIYQWAFKPASSSSPAAVERINQRNFGQICLILSFGPSEENSIQLEGKDICNGWLSRSGTYSNICNIPINCQ